MGATVESMVLSSLPTVIKIGQLFKNWCLICEIQDGGSLLLTFDYLLYISTLQKTVGPTRVLIWSRNISIKFGED